MQPAVRQRGGRPADAARRRKTCWRRCAHSKRSSAASRRASAGVRASIDLDLLVVGRETRAHRNADAAASRASPSAISCSIHSPTSRPISKSRARTRRGSCASAWPTAASSAVSAPESETRGRQHVPRAPARRAAAALHRGRRADRRRQDQPRAAAGGSARSGAGARAGRAESASSSASIAIRNRARCRRSSSSCSSARSSSARSSSRTCSRRGASADYLFEKDRLFARPHARRRRRWRCTSRWPRASPVDPPKPDLVVYLQAPVETLLQRIAKRGISYESRIDARVPDAAQRCLRALLPRVRQARRCSIVNAANIDPVQNQADYRGTGGRDPAHEEGPHVLQPAAPRYDLDALEGSLVHTSANNAIRRGRRSSLGTLDKMKRERREDRVHHLLRRELRGAAATTPTPISCWWAIRWAWCCRATTPPCR